MQIITRTHWNARPPKSRTTVNPGVREFFIVHHSGASAGQSVRAIQDWCMDDPPDGRGFADIDYNHLVRGTTGEIYEGRGWDIVGAHTTDYNTNGVGVCIIGTDQASDAAKASVRWLYEQYNARCRKTLKVRGHKDLATTGTDCPGDHVYAWVRAGMPAPTEEDDMATKEEIAAEVWSGVHWGAKSAGDLLASAAQAAAAVTALNAVTAKLDGLAAKVDAVDEEVLAKLGAAGASPTQLAAILRPVLGPNAKAVGQLLAGG